tara:strand:+ start:1107 stop:1286 length:180 start_codon:yes stop_codon:yes gene_type:complete
MDLLYSFLLAVGAYLYYKLHKYWLTGKDNYDEDLTRIRTYEDKVIIFIIILVALYFLFR